MKRPSFQFYPSDWLRDTALRSCSTGARGLWIDMICWMHEGTPYGHLKVGQKVILPSNLARMVGEPLSVVEGWLDELKSANVFQLEDDGTICSRRMIRDENLRNARAEGGKLGGNPSLKVNLGANLEATTKVEEKDNLSPTPSSSSSSSFSFNNINTEPKGSLSGTSFPPCPHQEILNLWKKNLPHLAQPRSWEGSRVAMLKARWIQAAKPSSYSEDGYATVQEGLEWWDSFFTYIAKHSTLAKGYESNGRVWTPDLPWVLNATNFQKIVDGKYDK